MKCLRKRKVPHVVTFESLEESSSEDKQKIRYFVFYVFLSILPILIDLYLYLCQANKTNPGRHDELPNGAQ